MVRRPPWLQRLLPPIKRGHAPRCRRIEDHNANSFVLEDLEEFTIYQVIVQAYNDVGSSQPSPPATERTREAGK